MLEGVIVLVNESNGAHFLEDFFNIEPNTIHFSANDKRYDAFEGALYLFENKKLRFVGGVNGAEE